METRKKNHDRIKYPALLLLAALVLLCTSCKKEEEVETLPPEETVGMANAYYFSGEDEACYTALLQKIDEAQAGFAAADLGRADRLAELLSGEEPDMEQAQALLTDRLEKSRILEKYPFVRHIPAERIVRIGDGTELYLAVPSSSAEGVTVAKALISETGSVKGETVLSYTGAYPVLLLADAAFLQETGGNGGSLTLEKDKEIPETSLDIGYKAEPLTPKDLKGTWVARKTGDDAGSHYDLYLEFDEDQSFRYYYIDVDEGLWKDQMIMHFSGTWNVLRENMTELTATADGGTYVEAGVPAYGFNGRYGLMFENAEKNGLWVNYISGDRFFTGIAEDELLFTKTTDQ